MPEPKLSPFQVNPEIMSRIRPMRIEDVPRIAYLHKAAMGTSFWANLGDPFLITLYRSLMPHHDFLGYVYEEDCLIKGFIAGTSNGPRMMRSVFFGNMHRFIVSLLRSILIRPKVLCTLFETFRYFSASKIPGEARIPAESLFCSFEPELRGKKISGHINKVLFDKLASQGHQYVKITSETDNEGAVRQLASWGFEQLGTFRFYGKDMIVWRLNLRECERVTIEKKA